MKINDGGSGNIYYGWIRFSTGAALAGVGPGTITIHDAAFESNVNQGIVTGDIGSASATVPESGSTLLLLSLAGGAMALRHRQQAMAA